MREREIYTTKAKSLEMNGNRLKVGRACYTLRATVKRMAGKSSKTKNPG